MSPDRRLRLPGAPLPAIRGPPARGAEVTLPALPIMKLPALSRRPGRVGVDRSQLGPWTANRRRQAVRPPRRKQTRASALPCVVADSRSRESSQCRRCGVVVRARSGPRSGTHGTPPLPGQAAATVVSVRRRRCGAVVRSCSGSRGGTDRAATATVHGRPRARLRRDAWRLRALKRTRKRGGASRVTALRLRRRLFVGWRTRGRKQGTPRGRSPRRFLRSLRRWRTRGPPPRPMAMSTRRITLTHTCGSCSPRRKQFGAWTTSRVQTLRCAH